MRAPIAILVASAAIATATGCGAVSDRTPTACLNGPGPYLVALRAAPADVRLNGQVPIDECLPDNQKSGDLASVGAALVSTATRLNSEARAKPGGPASLQLGYLLGVARDRARQTGGIHSELLRRLRVAALYSPGGHPLPPRFTRTFRRGERAAR